MDGAVEGTGEGPSFLTDSKSDEEGFMIAKIKDLAGFGDKTEGGGEERREGRTGLRGRKQAVGSDWMNTFSVKA